MARILLPNKDGSSAANVGDIVVTGGGIFEKTATGSVRRTDLESQTGYSGGVGNYSTLSNTVYNTVRSAIQGTSSLTNTGGGGGNNSGTSDTPTPNVDASSSQQPQDINVNYDVNGIGYLDGVDGIEGYNPYAYTDYSSGGSSETISNFFGYVLLGLVGLVILDRIVGGK